MFLKRFFNFLPKNNYSRAWDLFNQGLYPEALKIFEKLLQHKDHGEGLDATLELFACESRVALSRERMNEGNLEEALAEMEKAVALKPNFPDLRFDLGKLYLDSGRFEDAAANFRYAVDINPKYFKAGISLARAQFICGEFDAAVETLETSRENCPNFYKENVTNVAQMIRVNESDDVVRKAFHEILEEKPDTAKISREIAIADIQNENYVEAAKELKKAIALKPDYPDLHNLLGIAYGNQGMVDESIEEFEVALKIHPHYLKAGLNLALALYDCDRDVEARNHVERVLSAQPDNRLAHNLLVNMAASAVVVQFEFKPGIECAS